MTETPGCPCGSGQPYAACCGLYIDGGQRPDTAERLMRSRYTAYTLKREPYLLRTWHDSTRPGELGLGKDGATTWLGLEVIRAEAGGAGDAQGIVEFVARYKVNGKAGRLHEVSRFTRENGQWSYVDGEIPPPVKKPVRWRERLL